MFFPLQAYGREWPGFNMGEHNTINMFSEMKIFKVFPIISPMKRLIPGMWPVLTPGA